MIARGERAFGVATMPFGTPAGVAAAGRRRIRASLRFRREGSTDVASTAEPDAPLEFTVPESKLRLVLALEGLDRRSFRGDVKSGGSGYFIVTRINPSLNISGWFEPASIYEGIRKLWQRDSEAMVKGGMPQPQDVTFGRQGDWQTVSYALPLPGGTHCHMRAQVVRDGSWIDLHLSSVTQRPFAEAVTDLRAALERIQVSEKF
jgi:hypothetical protein